MDQIVSTVQIKNVVAPQAIAANTVTNSGSVDLNNFRSSGFKANVNVTATGSATLSLFDTSGNAVKDASGNNVSITQAVGAGNNEILLNYDAYNRSDNQASTSPTGQNKPSVVVVRLVVTVTSTSSVEAVNGMATSYDPALINGNVTSFL